MICLLLIAGLQSCGQGVIAKYGIVNDGETLTTAALQKAIDDCSKKGGGVVSLPEGVYYVASVVLKTGVTLHLEKGAVLLGSKDIKDYEKHAVVYAEDADRIAVTGEGEINGNGMYFDYGDNAPQRPHNILFNACRNVKVTGVKLVNSGFWSFRLRKCDGVEIRHITIWNHATFNNDGLDIESRNVTVSHCKFDTDDDAICFKNDFTDGFCVENVTVDSCDVASNCNFIKFGTASHGGFRNIKVANCVLHTSSEDTRRFWHEKGFGFPDKITGITDPVTGIAGIALEVVDGGFMENIEIANIRMTSGVQTPVFIRLGRRTAATSATYLKNIRIHDVTAVSSSFIASSISGVPGLNVDNVELRNIDLKLKGGGKAVDTDMHVPENEKGYPENRMYGRILPGYGFYIRHADNITLDNVRVSVASGTEERYTIAADDVTGLTVKNSTLQAPSGSKPVVWLKSCKAVRLAGNDVGDAVSRYTGKENTPDGEVTMK